MKVEGASLLLKTLPIENSIREPPMQYPSLIQIATNDYCKEKLQLSNSASLEECETKAMEWYECSGGFLMYSTNDDNCGGVFHEYIIDFRGWSKYLDVSGF